MQKISRSKSTLLNLLTSVTGQFLSIILQFVCRTVFIRCLSVEYLGVNGLISNILNVLSLAELGIGSAIIYTLYEPIANNDKIQITKLVNFYKRLYSIVAFVVAVIGLALIPNLDLLMNGEGSSIDHIKLIFILYLVNTIASYLMAHKRAIIEANQKLYIVTIVEKMFLILQNIIQIIMLIKYKNFITYLVIQVVCTLLSNIVISKSANRMYHYISLDKKSLPDQVIRKQIYKNIRAMSLHKLGTVVVYNTDNILLSMFVGLTTVGIYSNYCLIINNLKTLFNLMFASFTANIGNLGTEHNSRKLYETYEVLFFMTAWIYGFISSACCIFINPLIHLWVGEGYQLSYSVVALLFFCFYIDGMRKPSIIFKDALGLFYKDRYKPVIESIINLIVSIVLVQKYGIFGIFIGTAISCLLTSFWIEPYVIYRNIFDIPFIDYFSKYAKLGLLSIGLSCISKLVVGVVCNNNLLNFIFKCIIYTLVYNSLFIIITWRSGMMMKIKMRLGKFLKKEKLIKRS